MKIGLKFEKETDDAFLPLVKKHKGVLKDHSGIRSSTIIYTNMNVV